MGIPYYYSILPDPTLIIHIPILIKSKALRRVSGLGFDVHVGLQKTGRWDLWHALGSLGLRIRVEGVGFSCLACVRFKFSRCLHSECVSGGVAFASRNLTVRLDVTLTLQRT